MKHIAIVCLLVALATGCRTQSTMYPRSLTHPTGEYSPSGNLNAVQWAECTNESDAELVLVAAVTIPDILNDTQEFPVRRIFVCGVDGLRNIESEGIHGFYAADGVSRDGRRGIGCGEGSYWLKSSDGLSVSLGFDCYWTTDNGTQGKFDVTIPCLVGVPDEWALSETARLKVSYRPPRRESESNARVLNE